MAYAVYLCRIWFRQYKVSVRWVRCWFKIDLLFDWHLLNGHQTAKAVPWFMIVWHENVWFHRHKQIHGKKIFLRKQRRFLKCFFFFVFAILMSASHLSLFVLHDTSNHQANNKRRIMYEHITTLSEIHNKSLGLVLCNSMTEWTYENRVYTTHTHTYKRAHALDLLNGFLFLV